MSWNALFLPYPVYAVSAMAGWNKNLRKYLAMELMKPLPMVSSLTRFDEQFDCKVLECSNSDGVELTSPSYVFFQTFAVS